MTGQCPDVITLKLFCRRRREAARKHRWREEMAASGHGLLSLAFPRATWDLLDSLARYHAYRSRRELLPALISWGEDELAPELLASQLKRHRGTRVVQDKIMIPQAQLRFLARLRADHGISRSNAIRIMLIAMSGTASI